MSQVASLINNGEKKMSKKEEKKSNIFEKNLKRNKRIIYFYIGGFLVAAFGQFGDYLSTIIPDNELGNFIRGIIGLSTVYLTVIAPYIFGNKEELQDKKDEIAELKDKKYALHVTNQMKDHLLKENKITIPQFEDPNNP